MLQANGQGRGSWVRAVLLMAVPGLLGVIAPSVGAALPEDSVALQGVAAVLCMSPPWCGLVWLVWAVAWAWRSGWWGPAVPCAVAAVLSLGRPLACLPQDGPPPADAHAVVVVNVNAFSDEAEPGRLEAELAAVDADVVVVIEKRALEVPGMVRVADNFDTDIPRISHGSAVFCRRPERCPSAVTEEFGSASQRMPATLTRLEPSDLCLVGAHAPPPVPLDPTGLRPHVETIARRISDGRLSEAWGPCRAGDGVILAGDLNAVPRSPVVGMLHAAGLRDALDGAGIFGASWPAGGGWPDLPVFHLDHLLVGRAHVAEVRHIHVSATDHIGLAFRAW